MTSALEIFETETHLRRVPPSTASPVSLPTKGALVTLACTSTLRDCLPRTPPLMSVMECHVSVQAVMRAALAFCLFSSFGLNELCAAGRAQHSLARVSRQAPRATLDRFTIRPSGTTLTPNQAQRFGVIDERGRSVAVHWDLSGLDCSGLACGTIDENGNFVAPSSLTHAQVVVLEGVLVSDPKHSVLTRIRLRPDSVTSGPSDNLTARKMPQAYVVLNAQDSSVITQMRSPGRALAVPIATDLPTEVGPIVTYRDGQLTIDAENATLSAVLELIARKTGAAIELPPGTGLERIVERSGPAPVNEVLAQLLNGSRFNFVIVNSAQKPHDLAQVILSIRGDDATAASPASVTPVKNVTATRPDPIPPDVLEQMMKDKAREIRERVQQQ